MTGRVALVQCAGALKRPPKEGDWRGVWTCGEEYFKAALKGKGDGKEAMERRQIKVSSLFI